MLVLCCSRPKLALQMSCDFDRALYAFDCCSESLVDDSGFRAIIIITEELIIIVICWYLVLVDYGIRSYYRIVARICNFIERKFYMNLHLICVCVCIVQLSFVASLYYISTNVSVANQCSKK